MKKEVNKYFDFLIRIIFVVSSMFLSFYLIIGEYSYINVIPTLIVAFFCSLYLSKYIKEIPKNMLSVFLSIFSIIVVLNIYNSKGMINKIDVNILGNLFSLRYFILSMFSMICIINIIGYKVKNWLVDFYNSLDKWDKRAYLIATITSIILITVLYIIENKYFSSMDIVYSMDSKFVFDNLFNNSIYYDIRHPLINIFTYPIGIFIKTIFSLFLNSRITNLIEAIIIQIINSQLLILIGLQLKKITKNKMTFIIYMISFPTIINLIFLEKYCICTFFLVLYVYMLCCKNKSSISSLIAATFILPTNAFIGICEFLKKDDIKSKLKQALKIIIITIILCILFGRMHLLVNGFSELEGMRKTFSIDYLTFIEKFYCTINMLYNSLVALPSNTKSGFFWTALSKAPSLITIIFLIIIVIGIIKHYQELFVKISTIWILFSFVLFTILNWSPHTSALFTLLFSWATIPLFVMGIDYLSEKIKVNKVIAYSIIIIVMLITNIDMMVRIHNFLVSI